MKIEIKEIPEDQLDDRDYREAVEIFVDGKQEASFWDGEPEDNSLCRNFNDVHSISDLMKKAWEAGKNGEEFTITYSDVEL